MPLIRSLPDGGMCLRRDLLLERDWQWHTCLGRRHGHGCFWRHRVRFSNLRDRWLLRGRDQRQNGVESQIEAVQRRKTIWCAEQTCRQMTWRPLHWSLVRPVCETGEERKVGVKTLYASSLYRLCRWPSFIGLGRSRCLLLEG